MNTIFNNSKLAKIIIYISTNKTMIIISIKLKFSSLFPIIFNTIININISFIKFNNNTICIST